MMKIILLKVMKLRFLGFLLAVCSVLLISETAMGVKAVKLQPNQFQTYLKLGIEKSLNLETVNAQAYLQKALAMDPENPTAYAYMAMLNLFTIETTFDENSRKKYQDVMLSYVDEALARGEKRTAKNTKDSEAYLAMAMAKIAKVRWATQQKRYLIMAQETSNIWDYLEKAREGDPYNYDILFLMGIFHYHIDHLPVFTRLLSSILITSGDRHKGLRELELAAQKGNLLKQLAQVEIASVYLYFEKQPARALTIYRELKEKFPNNYNLLFALGNTLSDLHRSEEALSIARDIGNNIQAGTPPFVPELQPRYDQLMGKILFDQGDYAKASDYLEKALKNTSAYNARVRAWSYVRLGMINDARKERKLAEEYYAKALDVEGGEGAAQIEARSYLKTPYTPPKT
jgi:tetratricopeptide (TPR) repeat protein